jgi:hypothetical protein
MSANSELAETESALTIEISMFFLSICFYRQIYLRVETDLVRILIFRPRRRNAVGSFGGTDQFC